MTTPIRSYSSLGYRPRTPSSVSSNSSLSSSRPYSGTISVSIRPRPLSTPSDTWTVDSDEKSVSNTEVGTFTYDNVFKEKCTNLAVYQSSVRPVVSKFLEGYNATVFAYGMTGSGKTHSMQGTSEEPGVIDLAIEEIYKEISSDSSVSCSYLEIYNEKVCDLLAGDLTEDLRIRDDPQTGTKVVGLKEEKVSSPQQLKRLIRKGDAVRKTSGTDFNARSSRSHAIVIIRLNGTATLSLCDLAGSERASTHQERRKEGSFINKSLLSLSTVISKLSQQCESGTSAHIPYRDSKLTRLLQPSLSGESLVSILCTIHLSPSTVSETINTLRFAARAKNIVITAKKSESAVQDKDKIIAGLKRQIERLTQGGTCDSDAMAQMRSENRILVEQLEHSKRLADLAKIDQTMMKNESLNKLTTFRINFQDQADFDRCIFALEERFQYFQNESEELRLYTKHLEKQLKQNELSRDVRLLKDQQEEIEELCQELQSKDSIIKALRASANLRNSISDD